MQDTQDKIFRIDDPFEFLTKELLEEEYIKNKLTDKQIADKYNVGSKVTIWRRRKFWGISNSYKNKSNRNALKNREFSISIEDAKSYLDQGLTYEQIASKMSCSRMVAYRRMKEMGLISDQKSTLKKLKWHEPISNLQFCFFYGCLLGDGNLTPRGMFQCSHSHKQLEYIKYKRQLLDNLAAPAFDLRYNVIKNHQNGKTYYSYFMRTMQNEALENMYRVFYPNGIKIFPYDFLNVSTFDAYSLAIWYMDDGYRNENACGLCTQSFSYVENLKIIEFLHEKFGIDGTIQELNGSTRVINSNHKHYVRFNNDPSNRLFQIVAPYILPYFQYKLPEKYRQANDKISQNKDI